MSAAQVLVKDLIAAKDICELFFSIEDCDRSDSLATFNSIADTGDVVKKTVVLLFFCLCAIGEFCLSESTLLLGDFGQRFVQDDGLVQTTLLLGLERGEIVCYNESALVSLFIKAL